VIFSYPFTFDAPVRGGEVSIGVVPSRLVRKKTRMMGLPDSEKSLTIRVLILTEFTNVTDRQTDTHRMTA